LHVRLEQVTPVASRVSVHWRPAASGIGAEIGYIRSGGQADLVEIAAAFYRLGGRLGPRKRGKEQTCENANDRKDNQQLDERERGTRPKPRGEFTAVGHCSMSATLFHNFQPWLNETDVHQFHRQSCYQI
jgi:hypothetical protein